MASHQDWLSENNSGDFYFPASLPSELPPLPPYRVGAVGGVENVPRLPPGTLGVRRELGVAHGRIFAALLIFAFVVCEHST